MTRPHSWYSIRNVAEGVAEIYIYEQIGEDWWTGDGVTAKNFVKDLQAVTASQIDLHLNCPGGLVFDGQAIHTALRNHPASVTTYIDGLAASIASVIALAGDRVVMAENALFMIHDPSGGAIGTAADMRKMAEALDKIKDSIVTVYARTGQDRVALEEAMSAETWYSASEALAAGFVDEVSAPQQMAASLNLAGLPFRNIPGQAVSAVAPKDPGSGGAPDRSAVGGAPKPSDVRFSAARLRTTRKG